MREELVRKMKTRFQTGCLHNRVPNEAHEYRIPTGRKFLQNTHVPCPPDGGVDDEGVGAGRNRC